MRQNANTTEKINLQESRAGLDAEMLQHVAKMIEIQLNREFGDHRVDAEHGHIVLRPAFALVNTEINEIKAEANNYGFKLNSIGFSIYRDGNKPNHSWIDVLIVAKTQEELDFEEKYKGA